MKSILSVLQRNGIFACLMVTFSLSCMHNTPESKPILAMCATCSNIHERTLADLEQRRKNCKACLELGLRIEKKKPLLTPQEKLELEKGDKLAFKFIIFLSCLCARGGGPSLIKGLEDIPGVIIALNTFLGISSVFLAYEAFCNNPNKEY